VPGSGRITFSEEIHKKSVSFKHSSQWFAFRNAHTVGSGWVLSGSSFKKSDDKQKQKKSDRPSLEK